MQFPSPVYISEIRIIPLGSRVQADFPGILSIIFIVKKFFTSLLNFFIGGGNRLGATNPSEFDIEFFVNDLSVNLASTFEPLGKFSYNEIECINLECKNEEIRKIPTDGLVLKGCYNTITLAVYGNIITYGSMPKIPVQGNADNSTAQISSNEETNESDNGEVYTNNNVRNVRHEEFQDQNSSCDPTVSSTIADEFTKEDQPISSTSPVDIYSRSPSKEQDLLKSKREWSSPDESYQHKRTRVTGSYERRKPRTPPLQSPRISRPDCHDSDDETIKKSRLIDNEYGGDLSTTYCPSSPSMANNNTPIESPTEMYEEPVDLEPILSDEDIIDDVNGVEDLTDEMFAEEFKIETFNPFTNKLRVVKKLQVDSLKAEKFIDEMTKLCESYDNLFGSQEIMSYDNWLSLCEQILHCLHSSSDMLDLLTDNMIATIFSSIKIGLNFSLSIKYHQPGSNLRHLKVGIRLVECFASNERLLKWIIDDKQKSNVFENFFDLFMRQLIPMPVKLLIARVLYKLIDTKDGLEKLIENNGYKKIISMLSSAADIRLLYTLKSMLKKMHAHETVDRIKQLAIEIYRKSKTDDGPECKQMNEMESLFTALIASHNRDILQTRKFVPIATQFEVISKIKSPIFESFYKSHKFLESILLLLSVKHLLSPVLLMQLFKYLQLMMKNGKEFEYLTSDSNVLNDLAKLLFDSQTERDGCGDNAEVGLELAFKVETKFILDSISQLNNDLEIAEHLNALYYLCVGAGKKHVLEYIAMDDNLCVFLNLIDKEKKSSKAQGSPGFKHKSPVMNYSIDIVDFIVRNVENLDYLKKYGSVLINLVKHHDSFEPSVAAMLQEMSIFLKPLDIDRLFDCDDITPLIDTVKRGMEFLTNFPGDLIMTLRILRYMIVDDEWNDSEYCELKCDYYTMSLYHTTDGAATLFSVLEKLVTHFDQPMIHAYLFGANQGELLMKTVRPIIQILRKLLMKVIDARNVNYRDITAIETLLKTYTLIQSINSRCTTYKEAKGIQSEIIKILLAYTQPLLLPPDGMTTANIHKSLWTQMIGEIIKYTLNAPYRFTTGLAILSELLPLPLPVSSIQGNELSKLEAQRLVRERQLWSAHLHPQSQLIIEMVQSFCLSSSSELFSLLYKVCVQLSDLAPNMTLLISRSVVDLILSEAAEKNNEGNVILSRLLNFLSMLVRHACVKVSVLSLLSGKLSEVMSQILKITNDLNPDHVLSQFYVLTILQSLFDCEISMLLNTNHTPELILASGLPFKELIMQFTEDIVSLFIKTNVDILTVASLRTMTLLTEHDVTIKALKYTLWTKHDKIVERFNKIAECNNDRKHILIISEAFEMIRRSLNIEPNETSLLPPRTLSISINELSKILKWNAEEYKNDKSLHFLQLFIALVDEPKTENEENSELTEHLKVDLEALVQQLQDASKNIENEVTFSDVDILAQAEGIVTQFSSRVPFYIAENLEELNIDYWVLNPSEENDIQSCDQVAFDLNELVRECLPPETNIGTDCKRLFALSSSPQGSKDKNQSGLCFRTRRVEVSDPIGRPEKKIYSKCKNMSFEIIKFYIIILKSF